jgi:hypothetical protein
MVHPFPNFLGRLSPPLEAWLLWVGASVLATSLAFGVASLLLPAFEDPDRWAAPVFLPAFGILLALGQAVVLARWVRSPLWWFAASFLGWLLAYLCITALATLPSALGFASTGSTLVVFGASTGIAQWLMLRQHFASGSLWIAASLLGWAVLALIVGEAFTQPAQVGLVALLPAAATGGVLSWWRKPPRPPT